MSTTILTVEQRVLIEGECHARYAQGEKSLVRNAIELTEQAVLQSPEIQALRKDAERYQATRAAMLNSDDDLPRRMSDYAMANFANPHNPTPDEIDEAYDAAMEKKP